MRKGICLCHLQLIALEGKAITWDQVTENMGTNSRSAHCPDFSWRFRSRNYRILNSFQNLFGKRRTVSKKARPFKSG